MLHTIYITQKISGNTYQKLIKLKQIKKIEDTDNSQEFTTSYLKHEGLSIIKMTRSLIKFRNKKTGEMYSYHNHLLGIQLNPKRLIEKVDHIKITNDNDIKKIEKKFNSLIKTINPKLKRFMNWTLKRIDYCTFITTPYVKEYIKLFQNGDKPANFKNGVYDKKGNRYKQADGSMYYASKSGNIKINFYDKEDQLIKDKARGIDISDKDIADAKDYLRIEIQLDKGKTDGIKHTHKFHTKELKYFLSLPISKQYLTQYYLKTVGKGSFYKLDAAIKIVNQSSYTNDKKLKLINMLKLVNVSRSVWKARESFAKDYVVGNKYTEFKGTKETFSNYKKEINSLGVNLVTIPRAWEIDKLECLYDNVVDNLSNSVNIDID